MAELSENQAARKAQLNQAISEFLALDPTRLQRSDLGPLSFQEYRDLINSTKVIVDTLSTADIGGVPLPRIDGLVRKIREIIQTANGMLSFNPAAPGTDPNQRRRDVITSLENQSRAGDKKTSAV